MLGAIKETRFPLLSPFQLGQFSAVLLHLLLPLLLLFFSLLCSLFSCVIIFVYLPENEECLKGEEINKYKRVTLWKSSRTCV
ncbi:hypothetical protein CEXT_80321 [Caerostris extrusa]|uniref:ATP synthase F0 subunit 8 n=1 Tax=Caerostris extrusa TaxID=172846 RepID=A0AAV4W4G9_CAEEX|nr:hypothetical protein CEXT_80321 [Caerostris extrusa]